MLFSLVAGLAFDMIFAHCPRIMFAVFILVLCGCAKMRSDVTAFAKESPLAVAGKSYKFQRQETQEELEFASYAKVFDVGFKRLGMLRAESGEADYLVSFSYIFDDGKTTSSSVPIFGQTGGGTSYQSGTVMSGGNIGTYSGSTYVAPTYGYVGDMTTSTTIYGGSLEVRIEREGTCVYRSIIHGTGSFSGPARILNNLTAAFFQIFPKGDGRSKVVKTRAK